MGHFQTFINFKLKKVREVDDWGIGNVFQIFQSFKLKRFKKLKWGVGRFSNL